MNYSVTFTNCGVVALTFLVLILACIYHQDVVIVTHCTITVAVRVYRMKRTLHRPYGGLVLQLESRVCAREYKLWKT